MKIAVVILNWNGRKLLEQFLPGLVKNSDQDADVYVADNCSGDDSLEFVRKNFPSVHIILNEKNYGYAGGYNECLKNLEADYFVLINSDIEVTPGWIPSVISMMEKDKLVAACQPKILSYHQKNYFEHAGAAGGYIDQYGYPFCKGRIFNTLEKDQGQYDEPSEVFWATGACMFVRASVFKNLLGFDATFFAHMEEIDLCWRMKRNGFKVMVQPLSVVYHVGGGTLPKSNPRKTYLNFRNNMLMMHKNLQPGRLYIVVPFRLILDGIAAIKFLFSDSPADCLAVLKAHYYFYRNLSERIRIRRESMPVNENKKISCIYRGNLVFDYYILKSKFFSLLDKSKFTS